MAEATPPRSRFVMLLLYTPRAAIDSTLLLWRRCRFYCAIDFPGSEARSHVVNLAPIARADSAHIERASNRADHRSARRQRDLAPPRPRHVRPVLALSGAGAVRVRSETMVGPSLRYKAADHRLPPESLLSKCRRSRHTIPTSDRSMAAGIGPIRVRERLVRCDGL